MPNDDNKIILEFPATNVEIELGETITFDNISGFLDSERVTYDGESLTDEITHLENDKADAYYVDTELAKKADKTDTYTKSQVDTALNGKADKDTTYTKTQVDSEISRLDGKIDTKANASDVYTKSQTDNLLNDKADVTDLPDMSQYYDKSEVDDLLDDKANSDDVYDKAYIDTALSGKANVGTSYTKSEEDALLDDKADKSDTYTKEQVDDIVYNILPDDTASGSVANFTTSLELPIKSLDVDVNAVQNAGTPTPASPLPISGWSEITLVNCGNKYKPNIKPFSEWERARSDYYISRFSVPNTIITVNLIDKDTTVDLSGISFGYVDSNWDTTTPLTTTKYRWFIQGGTVQSRKRNISAGDASIILTGLIFYPATEATYNKLMARYDYEFVFSETPNVEPYNTEVISLGGTYCGGYFTQDKDGHRKFIINMEKDTMSSSYLSGLSSSYIGYDANVVSMNNHPCIWVRNWKYPPDAKGRVAGGIKSLCNAFKITMNNDDIISTQYRIYFDVDGMGITDAAGFISAIEAMEQNGNNLEIWYELETPYVIDLPDGEPISTLLGTNNIYADTGDTSVVFKDSVNGYVEKKIASVQALTLNT